MNKNSVIWILILVIIGAGIYYLLNQESVQAPTTPEINGEATCRLSEIEIISELENSWANLEKEIPSRPALGATSWLPPYHVQFMGNDRALIAFEDGHVVLSSVIEFNCQENEVEFNLTDASDLEFPLSQTELDNLIETYGDSNQPVITYTNISIFIDGEIVEINEWTLFPENIFVQ